MKQFTKQFVIMRKFFCREEEAIKLDGLSVAEMKQLRDQAEKFVFQAEVNRMMKLIINSLYRNKEVWQWVWSSQSMYIQMIYLYLFLDFLERIDFECIRCIGQDTVHVLD